MRLLLAALAILLAPSLASAECSCVCVGGRVKSVCTPAVLVEPICQRVCTDRIEQSLGSMTLSGGGGGAAIPTGLLPDAAAGGGGAAEKAAAAKAFLGR